MLLGTTWKYFMKHVALFIKVELITCISDLNVNNWQLFAYLISL